MNPSPLTAFLCWLLKATPEQLAGFTRKDAREWEAKGVRPDDLRNQIDHARRMRQ